MSPRSFGHRAPTFLMILLVTVIVAACGSQEALFQNVGTELSQPAASEAAGGEDGGTAAEPQGGGTTADGALAAPVEQRIIKTGEVSVEVADVGAAVGLVRTIALELGGYVGGSQAGAADEGATLTLRVPAPAFDETLERLRGMEGEVVAEATRESDVTRQIVDLAARIANLEASEASYRTLVERAERVEDILAVQSRLDDVRGEIEQLTAQLQDIEGDADLSTLTVTLIPASEPVAEVASTWDVGEQLSGAVAALVGIGQGLLGALIWFGIVWLPVLLVFALLALLALRAVLEVRRRLPAPASVTVDREVSGG